MAEEEEVEEEAEDEELDEAGLGVLGLVPVEAEEEDEGAATAASFLTAWLGASFGEGCAEAALEKGDDGAGAEKLGAAAEAALASLEVS